MTRIFCTAALSCVLLLAGRSDSANAQVFNNSRQRASSNSSSRTVTGAISNGRSGAPSSSRVTVPGMVRNGRSAKPVYSNSRYGSFDRGRSQSGFGSREYSRYPGRIQYSDYGRGNHRSHGHHHGDYHRHQGGLHPYDAARSYAGLSLQYSVGPFRTAPWSTGWGAGIGYPTILAPPIVVPFGGSSLATYGVYDRTFGPTLDQRSFPDIAPPSPGQYLPPAPLPSGVLPNAIPPGQHDNAMSEVLPPDQQPLINEFPTERVVAAEVAAVDRIRSLRYQTTGDNSFVRGDYADAAAFYETAADTAPMRQAPWLRLTWANITQRQFEDAAINLKKALLLQDDPTKAWVTGRELYGKHFDLKSVEHDEELWRWLEQRPNSTDRLLLTAAFQRLRGRSSVGKELQDAAIRLGLDQSLVDAMTRMSAAADDARQRERKPLPPANSIDPIEAAAQSGAAKPEMFDEGIRLRGRDEIQPEAEPDFGVGLPEPLEENEPVPFDLTIP